MKLYYLKGACSLTVHIALEWTKARYEAQAMTRESIKETEYLKLNPQGSVPCLVDGDFALSQNVAILEYLNEKYPQALLFGSDNMQERALARRWLSYCNADLHKSFSPLFAPVRFIDDESQFSAIQAKAHKTVLNVLAIADQQLTKTEYLSGKKSVADAYLFVILGWCKVVGIDLTPFAGLTSFQARMAQDQGVKDAMAKEGM